LSAQETSTLALKTEPLEFFRQDREARLTLKSQPEGALAKINGSTLGRTPLSVTLNGGECEVEVSLDGYLSQRERIVPVNGEELIREVVLSPVGKSSSAANSSRGNAIPTQPEQTIQEKSPSRKPQLTTKETATDSPGAHDLLNQARERRQLGDWAGAAKMYQMLIERFPDQSETGVALTGLGEIQLSRLRKPAVAMRSFDEYLRRFPNGVLTQEAAFGRIRALRQLGLEKEEAAAIQRFIAAYPNAIQARAARLRLKELEENP
jgi:TolA-binding protein